MVELIKVTQKGGKQVVSARELHEYVVMGAKGGQKGEMFSHWIQRMLDHGFIESLDYVIQEFDYKGDAIFSKSDNQRVAKREFVLSMDTAKQIAMIQNNDKGRQARQYFIECEKKLQQIKLPQSFSEALQLAADQAKQLELQAPKVENYDKFIDAKSLQGFKEVANMLGLGRNKMLAKLREAKILTSKNIPYQVHLDANRFEVKESTQHGFNVATTYVTAKGIEYIKKHL